MFCLQCGQRLPEASKFCSTCGAAQRSDAAPDATATPATVPQATDTRQSEKTRARDRGEVADSTADDGLPDETTRAGSRIRPVHVAVAIVLAVAAGIGGYAVSRRATPVVPDAPATPTATASSAADSIWGPFDPQELAAARRAFDQKIVDEEREAQARAAEGKTP